MNPTASSMAKSSRSSSSSLSDDLQSGSPPRSPRNRRSSEEAEPPTLVKFPTSPSSASSHLTVTSSPSHLTQNGPPSRIPLLKQPVGARRSLNLDVKPSPSCSGSPLRTSASVVDVGSDVSSSNRKTQGKTAHQITSKELHF